MAYIQMTTKGNGKQIAEVFIQGKELLEVLRQQGISVVAGAVDSNSIEQLCLTFQQNEEEKY